MPALRKCLTKPHFWLALVVVLAAAMAWIVCAPRRGRRPPAFMLRWCAGINASSARTCAGTSAADTIRAVPNIQSKRCGNMASQAACGLPFAGYAAAPGACRPARRTPFPRRREEERGRGRGAKGEGGGRKGEGNAPRPPAASGGTGDLNSPSLPPPFPPDAVGGRGDISPRLSTKSPRTQSGGFFCGPSPSTYPVAHAAGSLPCR